MKFIELTVKNYQILHGFNEKNEEVLETITVDEPTTKVIAIDRIQSISEKYILTSYHDRLIYWEYEGSLADIITQFKQLKLM
jgi:hypothetical protein